MDLGERLCQHGRQVSSTVVVDARAERGVQRTQDVVSAVRGGGRRHASRPPDHRLDAVVVGRQFASLVEHGQAHHVEPDRDRPDLLDLEHPS